MPATDNFPKPIPVCPILLLLFFLCFYRWSLMCLLEKKFLHLSILRDFLEARIYKVAKIIRPVMPFVWLGDETLEVEDALVLG